MKGRFLWRALRARYRDQRAELQAIRNELRPGDTVCDIGANKGSYLFWLSHWVGRGRVIAFEPQEKLANYLSTICRAMHLDNVTVEPKAVFSRSGQMILSIPGKKDVSPGASLSNRVAEREECRTVVVPVVSLDDYLAGDSRVRVLKIDVEGAEMQVFLGAAKLLKTQSPLLVFECENRHLESGSVADVFDFLRELGYVGKFVCGWKLRPLEEFTPDVHQRQTGNRFWDSKDYYNNFVFRKK
ncbi:FkbM family methyltransferase [bacterium]|nr:FkbM family methyltransferase [bacterium]MBU1985313.1 FkbM family methyltransferase [bacterium]